MIHELPEAVESATHAEIRSVRSAPKRGLIVEAVFGTLDEDGKFEKNERVVPVKRRISKSQGNLARFEAHQRAELGAPPEVVQQGDWRFADLASFLDEEGWVG